MTMLLLAAMAAPASANVFNGPNGEQTCSTITSNTFPLLKAWRAACL
jgi:hypothetical protein